MSAMIAGFGLISLVPLFFSFTLFFLGYQTAMLGSAGQALVLHLIALVFIGGFVLFGALTHSLMIAFAANQGGLIEIFRSMRKRFWRVLWLDILVGLLSIPGLVFLAIGMGIAQGTAAIVTFLALGIVYLVAQAKLLYRTPYHVTQMPAHAAIVASARDWKTPVHTAKHYLRSITPLLIISVIFAITTYVISENWIFTGLFFVANMVTLVGAISSFFPVFAIVGIGIALWWTKILVHLIAILAIQWSIAQAMRPLEAPAPKAVKKRKTTEKAAKKTTKKAAKKTNKKSKKASKK